MLQMRKPKLIDDVESFTKRIKYSEIFRITIKIDSTVAGTFSDIHSAIRQWKIYFQTMRKSNANK